MKYTCDFGLGASTRKVSVHVTIAELQFYQADLQSA